MAPNKEPRNPRPRRPSARSHPSNRRTGAPGPQGLYDPRFEHDACGVGFVVDIKGRRSHRILEQAIQILKNLDHRGACGAEPNTGDGAGVLIQMPHAFNEEVSRKARFTLPAPGRVRQRHHLPAAQPFGAAADRGALRAGRAVRGPAGARLADGAGGKRHARRDGALLRAIHAPGVHPPQPAIADELDFERKLYVIRKRAYNEIRTSTMAGAEYWYVVSLSSRTIVFKGMLLTGQLDQYFLDLKNPAIETALALVHSRFSTNTFPSWDRAHPYRYLAHNGEINTVRGNINWMHAREARFESEAFGADIEDIRPIINPNGSDSGMFDNTLELLMLAGRSLPHAMMMMIPEPWSNHEGMDDRSAPSTSTTRA